MGFFGRRKANKILEEGMEFFRIGDMKNAEAKYIEGLSDDPNSIALHLNYGDLLRKTERVKAAEVEYKKAMIFEPERGEPHGSLAALYHSQKQYEEAEKEYNIAISKSPDDINIKLNLAQLYMDKVRYTEMKNLYLSILPQVEDPEVISFIQSRIA